MDCQNEDLELFDKFLIMMDNIVTIKTNDYVYPITSNHFFDNFLDSAYKITKSLIELIEREIEGNILGGGQLQCSNIQWLRNFLTGFDRTRDCSYRYDGTKPAIITGYLKYLLLSKTIKLRPRRVLVPWLSPVNRLLCAPVIFLHETPPTDQLLVIPIRIMCAYIKYRRYRDKIKDIIETEDLVETCNFKSFVELFNSYSVKESLPLNISSNFRKPYFPKQNVNSLEGHARASGEHLNFPYPLPPRIRLASKIVPMAAPKIVPMAAPKNLPLLRQENFFLDLVRISRLDRITDKKLDYITEGKLRNITDEELDKITDEELDKIIGKELGGGIGLLHPKS
ncbi:MAG: hypothetical protein LBG13_01430 [Holosporales bacterium]|nr:hypothetical protein [Holosporales bacterium]